MVTDEELNESHNSSQIFAGKLNLGDSSPESDSILQRRLHR